STLMSDFPRISFITYTYNDHHAAAGLLRHTLDFGVPFAEMLVIDDASASPFVPPEPSLFPSAPRVLRLERKHGPGQAKRAGLNALTGDIFFSLDADIRPHKHWLKHALSLLARPDTGMVGAQCIPALAGSSLARARYRTFPQRRDDRDAPKLPGGCMLLRRSVWEQVGGLDDYAGALWEDVHLSRKILASGLRLLSCDSLPVYETRHLDRAAHCRREAVYYGEAVAAIVKKYGPERYLHDSGPALHAALDYARRYSDPILVYAGFMVTLLTLARALRLLAGPKEASGDEAARALLSEGMRLFAPYPESLALLRADLARAGEKELPEAGDAKSMPALAAYFAPALSAGVMDSLEQDWVPRYRQEDAAANFDAHYMQDAARIL
ncbi:glycosyltransferase family 2 protein, partial [Desulfovibrio sp. OttesenSCG-928-A18]|nr:glycosyltransferase family 2 protein [Desulfovibrio sp. OttesenSCG-928-A18]